MSADVRLVPGVLVERVGDDVVVLVPGRDESLRFSGDHANAVEAILRGDSRGVDAETVDQLVRFGVIEDRPRPSRRGVLTAGAVGIFSGVAVLSLPSVAAASSDPAPDFEFFITDQAGTRVVRLGSGNLPVSAPEGTLATLTLADGSTSTWTALEDLGGFQEFFRPNAPEIAIGNLEDSTLSYTVGGVTYVGVFISFT